MDGHETSFIGGVFREGLVTGWMTLMAPLTHGASLEKTLPDIIAHEELSDWWTPIQGPGHYHQAQWPTVHVSAWWDIFAGHHLTMFNGINDFSSVHEHHLFVGPLGHCMLGNLDPFLAYQEGRGIANAFALSSEIFDGKTRAQSSYKDRVKKINIYVQGSRAQGRRGHGKVGHYWSSFEAWPEPKTHRLLLGANSALTLESAQSASTNLRGSKAHYKEGYAEFRYDPAFPMVTNGGNNLILIFLGMGCGSDDQRHVEKRSDVVVFTTQEVLAEPLALMGQMKAVLYVSTDRPDTDFFVSVSDVHPDGTSMQIRYGIRRMRWRDSTPFKSVHTKTEAGVVYRLEVDLWFTSYIVAPRHRLRVMIGSSNTPYYAKNDGSGQDPLGFKFEMPAVNRVYFSDDYPSHVELPIVGVEDLPLNDSF
jgi:putative CocE/NonD family hydrolase